MYLPYALFSSTCLGQKSYYACAVSRDLRVGGQKLPQIWNPRPHIASSLDHFQGATVMIKGSLLVSIPIVKRFLVENFQVRKNVLFRQFSGPPGKTPGRICVKLTDNSFPVRPYVLPYVAPNGFCPFQRLLIK